MSNHGIAQDPAQSRTQTSAFAPRISGPLPGPKARAIVEADDRWISPSYTRSYPLVAKRGRGVRIEDAPGHCERARQAGARIVIEPTEHMYGERQYEAEDFHGHRWDFTETIADIEPESWGGISVKL